MEVKSVLLTGDDGYNSIGTRLLARLLRDQYDVVIAATKDQQSGMGGKLTLKGGSWGKTIVEEVPALWVDGSPVDAVEAAVNHYGQEFDLIISGVNLGANVGGSMISSGTFSAAFRAMNLGFTKLGLAMSWDLPPKFWGKEHTLSENIEKYLPYPGDAALAVIQLALENNFWGVTLLNVNFPTTTPESIVFTRPLENLNSYFPPVELDPSTHQFRYPIEMLNHPQSDPSIDVYALQNGHISITPCRTHFLDTQVYQTIKNLTYQLPAE